MKAPEEGKYIFLTEKKLSTSMSCLITQKHWEHEQLNSTKSILKELSKKGLHTSLLCHVSSTTKRDAFGWAFSGVYCPEYYRAVEGLWEEFSGVLSISESPWCVGGDFDVVRFPMRDLGVPTFFFNLRFFWFCLKTWIGWFSYRRVCSHDHLQAHSQCHKLIDCLLH